jgi:hypothetical protein
VLLIDKQQGDFSGARGAVDLAGIGIGRDLVLSTPSKDREVTIAVFDLFVSQYLFDVASQKFRLE